MGGAVDCIKGKGLMPCEREKGGIIVINIYPSFQVQRLIMKMRSDASLGRDPMVR